LEPVKQFIYFLKIIHAFSFIIHISTLIAYKPAHSITIHLTFAPSNTYAYTTHSHSA